MKSISPTTMFKYVLICLLLSALPLGLWAQFDNLNAAEASTVKEAVAVDPYLDRLLALGADTGADSLDRIKAYDRVLEHSKDSPEYCKKAFDDLLAWGADTGADSWYRLWAYNTVLNHSKDRPEYLLKALDGLLALGADTGAYSSDRSSAYYRVLKHSKGNEANQSYFNQTLLQLLERGDAVITHDVIKVAFENWNAIDSEVLIRHELFPSLVRELSRGQKTELLQALLIREYESTDFTPVIEAFEALSGVFRRDLLSQQDDASPAWALRDVFQSQGVAGLEAYIGNRAIVGIVTSGGLIFNSITDVGAKRMIDDPDMVVAYVTAAIIKALGIERFSGLIFPGSADNYPGLPEFTLRDMPEEQRSVDEKLYQAIYDLAKAANVPTFGICAGAQHLVLNRGGSLMRSKNYNSNVHVPAHTPLHYMMLSKAEQKDLLERCTAKDFTMNVFRAHSYAGVDGKLGEGVELSIIDGQTPLAFSVGFEAIGTQFHPEGRYQGVSNYAQNDAEGRQTNLLNFFFEVCKAQHRFVESAKAVGESRDEGVAKLRAHMGGILNRLAECKHTAQPVEMSWEEELW